MARWDWLTKSEQPYTWRFVRNVVLKGLILFELVNIVFALVNPMSFLGSLSIYNVFIPGRKRLPYGENPDQSYNLTVTNIDALFASHEIAGTPKAHDEYRVLVLGDSSVWGSWGLEIREEETLTAYLNANQHRTAIGKRVRTFNLGYPDPSLTKDVLLLQYGLRYQPDLIVWMVSLESFAPYPGQFSAPLVRANPDAVRTLITEYDLKIDPYDPLFKDKSSLWDQTILVQRRELADLLRLQLYGLAWAVTGVDQRYPRFYEPRIENFGTDVSWWGPQRALTTTNLAFDSLRAGMKMVGKIPVVLINEPIFISHGINSHLRYNSNCPRWAYDSYRVLLAGESRRQNWQLFDLWDVIPADQFTDTAIHLSPDGERQLAQHVGEIMMKVANKSTIR